MLIDSHAHIQGKEYAGEVEVVIARAHEAGVEKIIVVGGAGDMSSNYEAAREYLDLEFYLSFTGIITFKNAEPLREVVRKVPLERMFVETDSPYLTPVPHRGKRNEPAYVRFVADMVAKVKTVSLEEVASTTTSNVRELFRF